MADLADRMRVLTKHYDLPNEANEALLGGAAEIEVLRTTLARLTADLERAKGHAARWKALAKDVHRLWVRRPAYEPETMRLLGMGPTASGGFEIRVSAAQAVRSMADAFFELLQMHNAPNCVETGFTTSKGAHVSVEVRRRDGKRMAELRLEAIAERDALAHCSYEPQYVTTVRIR